MGRWPFRWLPAIIFIGIIFIASSTPGSDLPDFGSIHFLVMKGGHLLGYMLLGAAFLYGLSGGEPPTRSKIIVTGILVILHAGLDEWHQTFTPERNPSPLDICIDTAGGLLGAALMCYVRKRLLQSWRRSS